MSDALAKFRKDGKSWSSRAAGADEDSEGAVSGALPGRHRAAPRSISFEERLPRTDAGKLYKQVLIDKYSADER